MKDLLISIEKSLANKNWYAALTLALLLPDICSRVDNSEMKSGERYKIWFDQYVKRFYMTQEGTGSAMITGADCYVVRCALLHEFSEDLSMYEARKVTAQYEFCSPDSLGNSTALYLKNTGNEIKINIRGFCEKICTGANLWLRESGHSIEEIQQFIKLS